MGQIISGVIIEKSASLTFEEFCHAIQTQPEVIVQMIEYQLLQPQGETPEEWRFDSLSLRRGRIAAQFLPGFRSEYGRRGAGAWNYSKKLNTCRIKWIF